MLLLDVSGSMDSPFNNYYYDQVQGRVKRVNYGNLSIRHVHSVVVRMIRFIMATPLNTLTAAPLYSLYHAQFGVQQNLTDEGTAVLRLHPPGSNPAWDFDSFKPGSLRMPHEGEIEGSAK